MIYKRLAATFFDLLIYIPASFFCVKMSGKLLVFFNNLSDKKILFLFLFFFFFFFLLWESIFLTSIGKWLMNIRVENINQRGSIRFKLFFRSLLKYFTIISILGIILNIVYLFKRKQTWYDQILGLAVKNESSK